MLFTSIIYIVFKLLLENNISNYKDFVTLLVGKNGFILNIVVNLFMLITFFIMIAGFGAYFTQEVGISSFIGSSILACLCFFTFMTNVNGVLRVSSILVPIVIFFIVIIGILNFNALDLNLIFNLSTKTSSYELNWLLSSILYTSYNSILLIPVLVTLKKYVETKKEIIIISILSGMVLFILAISIFFMLLKVNVDINKLEMPIIYVIKHYYSIFLHIYTFIILTSIYTTAVSIGISFLENICLNNKLYPQIVLIMCITGFLFSRFGFSNMISTLYSMFGYLGIAQILLLVWK